MHARMTTTMSTSVSESVCLTTSKRRLQRFRASICSVRNLFHVQCRIPHAKNELLAYIDDFIGRSSEEELRGYREAVTRAFR